MSRDDFDIDKNELTIIIAISLSITGFFFSIL